jgi:hypothetical protein
MCGWFTRSTHETSIVPLQPQINPPPKKKARIQTLQLNIRAEHVKNHTILTLPEAFGLSCLSCLPCAMCRRWQGVFSTTSRRCCLFLTANRLEATLVK